MDYLKFKISDYNQAVDLWKSVEGVTLNESDSFDAISMLLDRNGNLSFVAKEQNRIVGTILCGHNGRAAQIYHLAVSTEFRRQGIGKRLVDMCFSQLAKERIPRCNIFVYSNNDIANGFWLRTGWVDPSTWKVLQKHV